LRAHLLKVEVPPLLLRVHELPRKRSESFGGNSF
jgi:hypothetical protein